jgi:hypothetical protein
VGAAPHDAVPRAFRVNPGEAEDDVSVEHRRTGRAHRLAVAVARPRPGAVDLTVRPADGSQHWPLTVRDLPERAAALVTPELLREIADLWFTDAETTAVCTGSPLRLVASAALLRAVSALAGDSSPMAVAEVTDLADLFALLDAPVPFDAQTAFARIRAGLPAERAALLAPVGRRLGFA